MRWGLWWGKMWRNNRTALFYRTYCTNKIAVVGAVPVHATITYEVNIPRTPRSMFISCPYSRLFTIKYRIYVQVITLTWFQQWGCFFYCRKTPVMITTIPPAVQAPYPIFYTNVLSHLQHELLNGPSIWDYLFLEWHKIDKHTDNHGRLA